MSFKMLSESDYGFLCLKDPAGADAYIRALHDEIERMALEYSDLKERIDLPVGYEHLIPWRDECYKRDQTGTCLDSDVVAIIDRIALLSHKLKPLERVAMAALKYEEDQTKAWHELEASLRAIEKPAEEKQAHYGCGCPIPDEQVFGGWSLSGSYIICNTCGKNRYSH
jgi:hypothetical protein